VFLVYNRHRIGYSISDASKYTHQNSLSNPNDSHQNRESKMTFEEYNLLKPGNVIAWHFEPKDTLALAGIVQYANKRLLKVLWRNGKLREYKDPQIMLDLSRLERLPGSIAH
jgi:hypothetical protein